MGKVFANINIYSYILELEGSRGRILCPEVGTVFYMCPLFIDDCMA